MQAITVARCRWIPTEVHPSKGGEVFVFENLKTVPFIIKRIFIIKSSQGATRGDHAHRHIEQVLYCVSGSCKLLLDDGRVQETVSLDNLSYGVYMGPYVWVRMFDFSSDCILFVVSNQLYDPDEYILDHADFLSALSDGNPLL